MRKAGQVLGVMAIGLGLGLISSQSNAEAASTNATPKSIRGIWYVPLSKKSYTTMQVTAHAVNYWTVNSKGHRISAKHVMLSSSAKYRHSYKRLSVKKTTAFSNSRYWWQMVDASSQPAGGFTDGLAFWTYRATVHHKKYRVLGTYQRQSYVAAYSKVRTQHDFSYTATPKQFNSLGIRK